MIVVISNQRSGSCLLCHALAGTLRYEDKHEILNVKDRARTVDQLRDLLEDIRINYPSSVLKMHVEQIKLIPGAMEFLPNYFRNKEVKPILLGRKSIFDQALSLMVSLQRNVWVNVLGQGELKSSIRIDGGFIRPSILRIIEESKGLADLGYALGPGATSIFYEDMCLDGFNYSLIQKLCSERGLPILNPEFKVELYKIASDYKSLLDNYSEIYRAARKLKII